MKVPSSEVSLPLHGCVILNAIERVWIFPFCQEMSVSAMAFTILTVWHLRMDFLF